MKKTALLALALLLAATLPLAGCELLDQPFPEETETDSSILIDPEKTGANGNIPRNPTEPRLRPSRIRRLPPPIPTSA